MLGSQENVRGLAEVEDLVGEFNGTDAPLNFLIGVENTKQ